MSMSECNEFSEVLIKSFKVEHAQCVKVHISLSLELR